MVSFISVEFVGIRVFYGRQVFSKELWEADGSEVPISEAGAVVVLIKGVTLVVVEESK